MGCLVPPGQRGAEPLDLTEVDEEGTLGAVHPKEGVAGVRGPAGSHPLQRGPAWTRAPVRPPHPRQAPTPCTGPWGPRGYSGQNTQQGPESEKRHNQGPKTQPCVPVAENLRQDQAGCPLPRKRGTLGESSLVRMHKGKAQGQMEWWGAAQGLAGLYWEQDLAEAKVRSSCEEARG